MRRMTVPFMVGVLIVSLGGCSAGAPSQPTTSQAPATPGSGGASPPPDGSPGAAGSGAASIPPPASSTAVSVQLDFFPSTTYAPLQRGITKGYFSEQGIDLTILPSTGSLDTLTQINTNAIQFAFVDSTTYVLQRIQDQTSTTAIYAYFTFPTFGIWSNKPLNTPADMVGTKFGTVAFSAGRYELPFVLERNGVDPAGVTIELMDFSVLYATLDNGDIDSAEAHVPGEEEVFAQAEAAGKTRYLVLGKEWGLKEYSKLLIARDDAIAADPDLVRRLVAGIDRSMTDALANATDDEIIAAAQVLSPLIMAEEATAAWQNIKENQTDTPGVQAAAVYADAIELVTTSQDLSTSLTPDDLFTNEFIPGS